MVRQKYLTEHVFVPMGLPTVTYVYRHERDLEGRLAGALKTPGSIVSLSGPSKSGKTVLLTHVIPKENLISLSGGAIDVPERLWERVLNWMEAPSSIARKAGITKTGEISAEAKIGASFLVKGNLAGASKVGVNSASDETSTQLRAGIDQVIREIANSDYIIFVDDFHYMKREVQDGLCKQIKEASEKGVRICTASVPHRSDDVVRMNPELRGRVEAVDLEYWRPDEIAAIGRQGFEALAIDMSEGVIANLAEHAFGSPQLMQAICLEVCRLLEVKGTSLNLRNIDLTARQIRHALEMTSRMTDYSSLLVALHSGPKQRGQERSQFDFFDASRGDVYRGILMALQCDPPVLTLPYDEILARIRRVCAGSAPTGSSVSNALEQMTLIAEQVQASSKVIDWSDDILDIEDPYFLFYLRYSMHFYKLGTRTGSVEYDPNARYVPQVGMPLDEKARNKRLPIT